MRILIAEDEKATARALKLLLEKNKFSVDIVHTGTDAWDYVQTGTYDTVVLDIMMPGLSGLEVLERMRNQGMKTPVLLLTAKSEVEDRVRGLNAGADDYLPKPFATPELIARVRALARRNDTYSDSLLHVGSLCLDCNRYVLSCCGFEQSLTNKEFQLMELLMRYQGCIFSTDRLMDTIWGLESESNLDVVAKHISLLRKKLGLVNATAEIRTVRGAGYCLEDRKC